MRAKDKLFQTLDDMEAVARLFDVDPFDIFFLGGAACLLGGYTDRATRDFDFIDLQYDAKMGKVFAILRDYDMLEYESTIIAPDYKERAKKLDKYTAYNAYILSPEDIVVSKIIRWEAKDAQDIDELIVKCDKERINNIINSVLKRNDLFENKKREFAGRLRKFRERYHV